MTAFALHPHAPQCSVPLCRKTRTQHCTFELSGKKTGQICGAAICDEHGEDDGDDPSMRSCPSHQRWLAKRAAAS